MKNASFKNNKLRTTLVKASFVGLITIIGLRMVLGISSYFQLSQLADSIFVWGLSNLLFGSFFIFSILSYLLWYQNVNHNYSVFKNEKRKWFFLDWCIPLANIVLPYKRLSEIYKEYAARVSHRSVPKIKSLLNIWSIAFLSWYILYIIQLETVPMFPEDIEIYYARYPEQRVVDEGSIALVQIIGLYTMIKIIGILSALEISCNNDNLRFEISEHLIDSQK